VLGPLLPSPTIPRPQTLIASPPRDGWASRTVSKPTLAMIMSSRLLLGKCVPTNSFFTAIFQSCVELGGPFK
jgi:hypothetical protein